MKPTEHGIEIESLRSSLREAETDNLRILEAKEIIDELMRIIDAAKREGSYIYQTASYGRAKHRAKTFLERQ